jgi:hypothetical protein
MLRLQQETKPNGIRHDHRKTNVRQRKLSLFILREGKQSVQIKRARKNGQLTVHGLGPFFLPIPVKLGALLITILR